MSKQVARPMLPPASKMSPRAKNVLKAALDKKLKPVLHRGKKGAR